MLTGCNRKPIKNQLKNYMSVVIKETCKYFYVFIR